MNKPFALIALAGSVAIVAGCATAPSPAELDQQALAMIKASFRDQGIAKVERLNQDLAQQACSAEKAPSEALAKQVEAEALATVKWPSGGHYVGDWTAGERLAQNGVGMAWNNPSADPAANGGQCYNCHQINRAEVSFGTIGPSLWNYGKLRGVRNLTDPAAAAVIQYTWSKLWNSKAFSAGSTMPRFGHMKLLNEQQIRDVMALLLDPKSPVNQ